MSLSHAAKEEIARFLQRGKKFEAIKHLRDVYGFSLAEATVIIEALEPQIDSPSEGAPTADGPTSLDESSKNQVIDLLIDGRKIEAIRFLTESMNIPLKTATDHVAEIERYLFNPARAINRRPKQVSPKILLMVFLCFGMAFIGIAGYLFFKQSQSIAKSDLIRGKVIRMETNSEGMSAPLIEYEWAGKKWMYASNTYSNPPAYEVDEEVPVYVNREDPGDITVDTFSDRWLLITILGTLGVLFAGISIGVLRFASHR